MKWSRTTTLAGWEGFGVVTLTTVILIGWPWLVVLAYRILKEPNHSEE